jgi:hypothetical protein
MSRIASFKFRVTWHEYSSQAKQSDLTHQAIMVYISITQRSIAVVRWFVPTGFLVVLASAVFFAVISLCNWQYSTKFAAAPPLGCKSHGSAAMRPFRAYTAVLTSLQRRAFRIGCAMRCTKSVSACSERPSFAFQSSVISGRHEGLVRAFYGGSFGMEPNRVQKRVRGSLKNVPYGL